MLKIEETEVVGFRPAIRGMRNPKNSWDKSDSKIVVTDDESYPTITKFVVGENDLNLMKRLASGGPVHAKYRRMLVVYFDVTAPMYWWKEFDTYKIGTVRNSCSTMHKIHVSGFEKENFSNDAVYEIGGNVQKTYESYLNTLEDLKHQYNDTGNKKYWRALIQMLPDGFNSSKSVIQKVSVL